MAHYRCSFEVALPADRVFGYIADLRNMPTWDPTIVNARRVDQGPLTVGSQFELAACFLGRHKLLPARVLQLDPPQRIALECDTDELRMVDAVDLEKTQDGTRVSWQSSISLRGLRYVYDIPLHLGIQWMGRRAIAGLRRELERLAA